jgi:hypothetical protein
MAPFDLLLAILFILLVSRIERRRRARVARKAQRHVYLLRRMAELTDLTAGDIAGLLSATPEQVALWETRGVPSAWQAAVAELFRVALALRSELPPGAVGRLLTLKQRRAFELERMKQVGGRMGDLRIRFSPRHFVIRARS